VTCADSDGASWRTIERQRNDDIEFLERLRVARTLEDVGAIRREQRVPCPEWRRVAIVRAAKRVVAAKVKS